MVFMLLVFFVVTTAFVEEAGLPMDTPEMKPDTGDSEPIVLQITKDLAVLSEGVAIPLAEVADYLAGKTGLDEPILSISVAPSAPAHLLVAVTDAGMAAGIQNVTVKALVD